MVEFGKIKTIFHEMFADGLVKKDKKTRELFIKYLKTIKESEILKTEFKVYNNIENRVDEDTHSATQFIDENLKFLYKYPQDVLISENKKLAALLGENPKEVPISDLYENLDALTHRVWGLNNVHENIEAYKKVVNYVKNNKPTVITEKIAFPTSVLTNVMIEKFNEKYKDATADEKQLIKVLSSGIETIQEFYTNSVNECINKVDALLLKETDETTKDKLTKTKEKLITEGTVTEEDFVKRITKIIELKNNLIV